MKSASRATNKLHDLRNIICLHDTHLVAITETWLNANIDDYELLPARFCIYRKDRHVTVPDRRGGGLLLGLDTAIPSRRRDDLEPPCEILVCEINVKNAPKLAVVLCYRPPQYDKNVFISHLHDTLFKVYNEYTDVFLLGDFNFPDINWNSCTPVVASNPESDFLQLMDMFLLSQINDVPSNKQNHMLDLMFINSDGLVTNVSNTESDYDTDHAVLYFEMHLNFPKIKGSKREVYNYKKTDFNKLSLLLNESSLLDVIATCNSIDEMWCKFKDIVLSKLNLCAPKVVIKDTRDAPWIDSEVRHIIKKKNTAWRKAKRTNSNQSWLRYRSIRNQSKSLIKIKRDNFISSLQDVCKTNPKRFWSFFHFKNKSQALPDIISDSTRECSISSDKATLFNSYFGSVLTMIQPWDTPFLIMLIAPQSLTLFSRSAKWKNACTISM